MSTDKILLGDMNTKDLRKYGYQVVDWIVNYFDDLDKYPVLAQVKPGQIKDALPRSPPDNSESMDSVLEDLDKIILPGITHWNHPAFFAYFSITGSAPGILGELLCATLNVNAMLWKTSPAATELEEVVLDWLRQMLGIPEAFQGILYDTASVSSLHAMAAAREAQTDLRVREEGLAGRCEMPTLRLYTSEQAHSSIEKGAILIGIGQNGVRKIPTDDDFRMDVAALERAIEDDIRLKYRPFCVVATVGTTSTTSIDPVDDIAEICERHRLWLHVDAAYGGAAAILPEMQHVLKGCERADSIVVNPHKWLFTPLDASVLYCKRPDILKKAFGLVPEYLRTSEDEKVRNYMDYGIQLGRRFRALKLWMIFRYFGKKGIAARIREHIRLAQQFASWIDEDPNFERMVSVPFSTVCFRAVPKDLTNLREKSPNLKDEIDHYIDKLNEAILDAVDSTGQVYLSHTRLRGRFVIRLAIGNIRTTESHVSHAWEVLRDYASKIDTRLRPMSLATLKR